MDNQTGEFPPITPASDHVRCGHGPGDLTGYVVTYASVDAATGATTFNDIEWIDDATQLGYALEVQLDARAQIQAGRVQAADAVLHLVYEDDHRIAA